MEEKKFPKGNSSLRPVFDFGRHYQSFRGKFHLSKSHHSARSLNNHHSGFTLIELLIVIIILAVLATLTLVTLNPITQIQKGQDAERQQDLKQINTALDTYYNDKNCYPTDLSWLSGAEAYMKKVPNDPVNTNGWQNYDYVTDGSDCPQWNVLFAKVNFTPNVFTACPLNQTHCFPGSSAGYNYCVLSGNVNCNFLKNLVMTPVSGPFPTSGAQPTSGAPAPPATSTPTPTVTSAPPPPPTGTCLRGSSQCSFDQDGARPNGNCDGVATGTGNYCASAYEADHVHSYCTIPCQ